MSEIMQFLEATFTPLVLVFTVSNMAVMGLELNLKSSTWKKSRRLVLNLITNNI